MIQFEGHPATVCSLAFSPDSMTLASAAKDGGIRLWDSAGGLVRETAHDSVKVPPVLAWYPFGDRLAVGVGLFLYSLPLNSPTLTPDIPLLGAANALAFVTDTLLAIGVGGNESDSAGRLVLWDVRRRSMARLPTPVAGSYRVRRVTTHPPSKRIDWLVGVPGSTAHVWRSWVITSPSAREYPLRKPANDLTGSPDGSSVAVASEWLVRLFTADGQPRGDLSGHKGQVSAVGFVNGGRTVVSASWDETVRFWDVSTGKETARFPLGVGKLTCLAVSPDGTRVAVGGTDGPITLIDAE